jgi:hypothetical protein
MLTPELDLKVLLTVKDESDLSYYRNLFYALQALCELKRKHQWIVATLPSVAIIKESQDLVDQGISYIKETFPGQLD